MKNTEWHVACSSSGVLTPQDGNDPLHTFPIVGFMQHELGGGCIAHSHPGPQCFYVTEGEALFQVSDESPSLARGR